MCVVVTCEVAASSLGRTQPRESSIKCLMSRAVWTSSQMLTAPTAPQNLT